MTVSEQNTLRQILKDTGYELEYQSGNIIGCVKEWLEQKQKEEGIFHTIGIPELLEDLNK